MLQEQVFKENDCSLKEPGENMLNLVNDEKLPNQEPSKIFTEENVLSKTAVLEPPSNVESKKISTPSETMAGPSTESGEDAYIVVDEIESNVIDTGDEEESPKKTNTSREQQLCKQEISPGADGQKSDTGNQSTTFKNGNFIEEMAEDAEAIEEEIDSWLGGISSDESMKMDDDDDSEVIDKALETICKEEEIMNQKLSDSEEINSVLEEMCQEEEECMKLSDSEAIDSVLKDICKEENENQYVKDDDDERLSTTDDGSLKDDIDIDSVIEAVCDDEDEICSRVDSILKNKSEEDEEEDVSDSDAIVAVVDAISEEDGENLICSVKENLSSDNACQESPAEKAASDKTVNLTQTFISVDAANKGNDSDSLPPVIMSDINNSPHENVQQVEQEVKSVLHALCNVVALQLDQMITSERIAVMESVLHQTVSEKQLSAEEQNSSLVTSNAMSSAKQVECNDFPLKNENESTSNAKRRVSFDSEEHKGAKKQKLGDNLEAEIPVDNTACDDNEVINVSEQAVNDKVSIENEEEMKVEMEACDEEKNTGVFDSASSAEVSMDHDSNQESKTEKISAVELTRDRDSLVIVNTESSTESIKANALDVLEGIVCLPSPQVLSILAQNANENSSDSDRSFCRALKIEENLQNIIKSLSSPKHDSDMELDISTAETTNISGPEKISAVTELSSVKNVKIEAKSNAETEVSCGMISEKIDDKAVIKDITKTSSPSKLLIEEDVKLGTFSLPSIDGISVPELKTEMKLIVDIGSNAMHEKLPAKPTASNENSFVEIAEGDVGRFVRAKVHEFCMKKSADTAYYLQNKIKQMKQELEDQKKYTEKVRIQMRELATQQSVTFRQYGYNPKVEKRTVGVNVRIVQQTESKLKTYGNPSKNYRGASPSTSHITASPKITTNVSARSSPATSATLTSVISPKIQPPQTVQANKPMQLLVTSASTLSSTGSGISSSQSVGSRVAGASTSNVSLPVVLPSNAITTSARHQVVDLTDDNDSPSRHHAATAGIPVRATMPVCGQLPSKSNTIAQNLVPFPLMTSLPSMVQFLPTGTTVSSRMADVNTIRMMRSSALPPNTRLAYFAPHTPGALPMIHHIRGSPSRLAVNVPPQQSVIQNMRHPAYVVAASMSPSPQGAVAQTRVPVPNAGKVLSAVATTTTTTLGSTSQLTLTPCFNKHPAPLPPPPVYPPNPALKALPPKPSLKMNQVSSGIVLSWNMCLTSKHANIVSYQLYAYQEHAGPISSNLWKKVGDIKALPLPMACTLTQFVEGHRYHFAVRAIDCYFRVGPFSDPENISLFVKSQSGDPTSNKSSQL